MPEWPCARRHTELWGAAEAVCAIEGVVVDQNGTPVPGLVLLLDKAAPDPQRPGDADRSNPQ